MEGDDQQDGDGAQGLDVSAKRHGVRMFAGVRIFPLFARFTFVAN